MEYLFKNQGGERAGGDGGGARLGSSYYVCFLFVLALDFI